MNARRDPGQIVLAVLVLALGVAVVAATAAIEVTPIYSRVGPRVFPFMVGGLTTLLGIFLLGSALRGAWPCEATDPDAARIDWLPLGLIAAGLLLNILLIDRIGFILSSTIMFTFVAKAFDVRRLWLAALIGFVLALVAYFGFANLLGLRMGNDPIEAFVTSTFRSLGLGF